ncbi:MAG: heavy metal translocating P-type ATPase [Candidatus Ancillula sp.]|jgi:heavy metal translocating P-type ATPase|nr:heavy metal translocating P-type ATPase [Candidatus Ancillula sp.]
MSAFDIVLLVLSIAGAGYSLFNTIKSLKEKDFGLDILAFLAIVSALAVREFLAAFVVVLMMLTGDFLEYYANRKAKAELNKLYDRSPRKAHLIKDKKTEMTEDVLVNEIKIGDWIKVMPGEVIPVDGKLETAGVLDESSITGESMPVEHKRYEDVLSGAVTTGSPILIKATKTAEHSQYQTIISLVEAAANQKSKTVKVASQISIPFTVISIVIAGTAWIMSGDPMRFAEVLVLATPCPLLIAAPVAFIGGVSRAAKYGIIIKSPVVLEAISKIKIAAFDKTGTLTKGTPFVQRIEPIHYFSGGKDAAQEIIQLAASLEVHSAHVLAQAIVDEYHNRYGKRAKVSQVENLEEVFGNGLQGKINGKVVRVGKLHFVQPTQDNLKSLKECGQPQLTMGALGAGEMAVYVSIAETKRKNSPLQLLGRVVLKDQVRENSCKTVEELKDLGVKHIAMLTGDRKETADAIGSQLRIDDIRSELLPQQKLEAVLELQKIGQTMMVGDGTNDAPVLAGSDVGVALAAKGRVAASESADVVIMQDDIIKVAQIVEISRQTVGIAKESMVGGIVMSIILMLVASFGFIPAVFGALLQEVIDVFAITNGVRAAFKRI